MKMMRRALLLLCLSKATPSSTAFHSATPAAHRTTTTPRGHRRRSCSPLPPGTTSTIERRIAGLDDLDPSFVAGSVLWGLNFYYGFDWILAPLGTGLDSDFNPATRATTFLGRLAAGQSLEEAAAPVASLVEDGERPEMGSRVGTGANAAYAVALSADGDADSDWLSDREAGLSAAAPLPLRVAVASAFAVAGTAAQVVTGSFLTAAVLVVPALVYEIGRPSLPTREEAALDARLDVAVAEFVEKCAVVHGRSSDDLPEGVAPARRDEATNERELVSAFRARLDDAADADRLRNEDVSDFQIEIRLRSYGVGRSAAGFIKGIRLLRTSSSP